MKNRRPVLWCAVGTLLNFQVSTPAYAELSCAPVGAPSSFAVDSDPAFPKALAIWQEITKHRPVEGSSANDCKPTTIPGYEGFPTMHCIYSSADAGKGKFPPITAQIIVLNPSAKELARWSVHACRINLKPDKGVDDCLTSLTTLIIKSNGAQFPVVGSVIESDCAWQKKSPACSNLSSSDPRRKPSNTWFRNGVSIGYTAIAHWDDKTYDYSKIFDFNVSDQDIQQWYNVSRLSTALRTDWTRWRAHIGKSLIPDGVDPTGFDIDKGGWGIVSQTVQKRACIADNNELMDAIVYTRHL